LNEAIVLTNLAGLRRKKVSTWKPNPSTSAPWLFVKSPGNEDRDVATILNNLAGVYHSQGKYKDAELYYRNALAIVEKRLRQSIRT